MDCTEVREHLLDHVYGACEDAVAAAVEAHLPGCEGCRAALDEARGQRALLAEAAALPGPVLDLRRTTHHARRTTAPGWGLRRWAWHVAAALLVVMGGVLGWRAWERAGVAERYPSLVVRGPSVLSSAGGRLMVEARDAWDRPVAADVTARVFDARGKEVGQAVATPGEFGATNLDLAGDLGKPGEYLAVQIAATFPGGDEPQRRLLTPVLLRDAHHLLARVATDKPLYRPGEVVRARFVALERESLRPAGAVPMRVRLKDPRGGVVQEALLPSQDGVSAYAWQIDPGAVGGEWSVECSHDAGVFPVAKRTFVVRAYQQPRLRTELKLDRDSYAPGQSGHAWLTVERAEGGVPADAPCEVCLTVDGREASKAALTLPASGLLRVPFEVPAAVESGRGLLSVAITDGGVVETATKTVPIALDRLDVEFFPEGGDLVAGLPNRVYFEVRDALGEPADQRLELLDGERVVATGWVFERGMGVLEFTPRAGVGYRLRGAQPLRGEFPAAVAQGVTLRALEVETAAGVPIRVEVGSTAGGEFTLVAVCRGAQVGTAGVRVAAGATAEAAIPVAGGVGGVMRVTVFDAAGVPRAERLVSVAPMRRLAIDVKPERERYAPGESVAVTVTARDESGKPAAGAVLGAAVVNQAVIDFAHDDDTPDLPMHFLLGLEVKELEEVEVYADGPDAKRAVDLLLGVQGWRRFAWKDAAAFVEANPDDGPRVAPASAAAAPPLFIDTRPVVGASLCDALAGIDARIGRALFPVLAIACALAAIVGAAYSLIATFRRQVAWRGARILAALAMTGACLAVTFGWILDGRDPDLFVVSVTPDGAGGGGEGGPIDLPGGSNIVVRFSTPAAPGFNAVRILDAEGGTPLGDAVYATITSATTGTPTAEPSVVIFRTGLDLASDNLDAGIGLGGAGQGAWSLGWGWPQAGPPTTFTLTGQLVTGRWRHDPTLLAELNEAVFGRPGYAIDQDGDGFGDSTFVFMHSTRKAGALDDLNTTGAWSTSFAADEWRRWWEQNEWRYTRALVREHRQPRESGTGDETRRDFTEVLYWNPLLVTDAKGEAEFTFDTCDAIAAFRIGIDAHDARGALASAAGSIQNRVPFFLEPKLPVALSAGDRLLLPVAIVNDTETESTVTTTVTLDGALLTLEGRQDREVHVAAGGRTRVLYPITAQNGAGEVKVKVAGTGPANHADASERTIPVQPRGYPVTVDASGVIEKLDSVEVLMPETVAAGTLSGGLRVYPSMLATLADGLEGMLRMPSGCFEQVSSSNYPNLLILTYLEEQQQAAPEVARTARGYLATAYQKLAGYECPQRGFEWYGDDPGHVALTAFGLMQFVDMGRVFHVDDDLVVRTRDWLLRHRDGQGGFTRNAGKYASFDRSSQAVFDGYVTWALSEARLPGVDLAAEVRALAARAEVSDDPYLVALAANTLLNRGEPAEALVTRLARLQQVDGRCAGTSTSITSSTGQNLDVETTALAALAFTKVPARLANAERAVRWILEQRRGSGSFGATQACILALRALVAHARVARRTSTDHDLTVLVNDVPVHTQHVAAGTPGAIAVDAPLLAALRPGTNRVELRTTGAETLPWALGVTYRTLTPPTHPDCAVRVATALSADTVTEGGTVRCTVTVRNVTNVPVPMTLARVGLPAGLSPRVEQLKELREQGVVGLYETRPREVTLYWRGIAAGGTHTVHLDLVADIPGSFEGPATSAYLYYSDDRQAWAAPLRVDVEPRE